MPCPDGYSCVQGGRPDQGRNNRRVSRQCALQLATRRPVTGASLPSGVATSIGSLPHTTSSEAVSFVLELQPELPAAPSIPVAAPMEGMTAQAAWGIAGVTVRPDGSLTVDAAAVDPEAPLAD